MIKYVSSVGWYVLLILCSGDLLICLWLFMFYMGTLNNTVVLFLFPVRIVCSYFTVWKFVYVNTALYPSSHILYMEINELCVSRDRIQPSLAVKPWYRG